MANKILIKRSGNANVVPGSLDIGELAINYTDGNLFYSDGNTVKVIASNKFVTVSGNISGNNISASGSVTGANLFVGNSTANVSTLGGNVTATGTITATTFVGDGSQLTGIDTSQISNGNASVQSLANANITVNPAGTANVAVFHPTGANITGNLVTSGNVTATYFIGNGSLLTGIDATLISNGNARVQTQNDANVVISVGADGNTAAVFHPAGANITGNLVTGGIWTDNYYDANGAPIDFQQAAGANTQIQYNLNDNFGASENFTFNASTNTLAVGGTVTATGNITGGNLVSNGTLTTTGNATVGNSYVASFAYANPSGATFTQNTGAGTVTTFAFSSTPSGELLTFKQKLDALTAGSQFSIVSIPPGTVSVVTVASVSSVIDPGKGTITYTITYSSISAALTGSNSVLFPGSGADLLVNGKANIAASDASTSTTSGALVVAGGAGIGGNINVGGMVAANGISSSTTIVATGNITGGNLTTSGAANVGSLVTGDGIVAAGNIQSNATVLANAITSVSGALSIAPNSGNIVLFNTSTGQLVLQNNRITGVATPTNANDAVTKQYVDDAVSSGITVHAPVQLLACGVCIGGTYAQGGVVASVTAVAADGTVTVSGDTPALNDQYWFANSFNGVLADTAYFVVSVDGQTAVLSQTYGGVPVTTFEAATGLTQSVRVNSGQGATLTNNGAQAALVIDGVEVQVGNRVLLESQQPSPGPGALSNGVYVVTTVGDAGTNWVLTRAPDADTYIPDNVSGMDSGDYFYVQTGDTKAGQSHVLTAPVGPIIIGLNDLTYTQFGASQVYSANNGIALTGTKFTANVDGVTTAIVGGNIAVKASAQLTTPNIGEATGVSLTVTGNVVAGNVDAGTGAITTTGTVSAGNANVSGAVTVTGNVTGGNIVTAGTANVATLVVTTAGNITATTASTNTTSGALIVAGGVGVAGNIYAGALYDNGVAVLTIESTVDGGTY
jgi:hypothetical protein